MTPPEQSLIDLLSRKYRTLREHIGGVPHRTTLFVVLVVALGALTVTTGPALSQSGESPTPATEANNSTAAPGAQVASAVSVEGTLLSGDVQRRTLDVKLTRAASDRERAAIVATTISTLNSRLDALETRSQRFQDVRRAGQVSIAAFHTEYAPIAAEARTIDRTLGRLQTAATELPATQFEAQYTNTTSIDRLDEHASALTDGASVTSPASELPSTATPTSTATPVTENATTAESAPTTDRPTENTEANGNDSTGPDDDDSGDDDADDTDDETEDDEDDEGDDTDDTNAAEDGG